MKLEPFELERIQSTWEHLVDYNLSESGVHPMSFAELTGNDPAAIARLAEQELGYSQTNGTVALRERIAALYPGATPDHILVTNGTSEANFVTIWSLLEADDELVLMLPNYMQIWGIARGFQGQVKPFYLREQHAWSPDLDELCRAVTAKTRLIAICNPNNPTGGILSKDEMQAIIEMASSVGAWLLADEVYQGAERDGERTKSFWGSYEKVIVTNGLSKAYGLPGLRIGWVVAPTEIATRLWSYRDYTTIAPGNLSDQIAQIALEPETRERILARTRNILRANYPLLTAWLGNHAETFTLTEPRAGAIAFLRYQLDINSTELTDRLRRERSVLIVPGDHFGLDHYLRIGYGSKIEYLQAGLERIHDLLLKL
jgi:aspartate/methionine/tyrosine aminotransferase